MAKPSATYSKEANMNGMPTASSSSPKPSKKSGRKHGRKSSRK